MKIQWFSVIILTVLLIGSCDRNLAPLNNDNIDYSEVSDIRYSRHVQPLLNRYCLNCHGPGKASRNLRLDSWDKLIAGSDFGEALIPFDPENSLMMELLTEKVGTNHPADLGAQMPDSIEIQFLGRWIAGGARNDEGKIPYQNSRNLLYVCNQNSGIVSILDTKVKLVTRNINFAALGLSSNSKPHDVAVEPDGSFWYVSLINDSKILKFNRENELVGEAEFTDPGLLALHPTKDFLYVGHTLSIPSVPPTLGVIRRSDMNLTLVSLPFSRPHALAADNSGRYIYLASLVQPFLATIDTDTDQTNVSSIFNIPGPPRTLVQMNISPDNSEIYLSSQQEQKMLVLDIGDPQNVTFTDSVIVGRAPWHPKYSPDGNYVYVGNNGSNTVSVINTVSRREELQIGTGDGSDGISQPHGLVISRNGETVWVSNRNTNIPAGYAPRYRLENNNNIGTVVAINTGTKSIEKVIEIEKSPSGIAIYEN